MAAGGTGGHIFPALAVAEELRSRAERRLLSPASPEDGRRAQMQIEFLGTGRGLEARLIPARGFALRTVRGAGLKGMGGWRWVQNLFVLPKSAIETARVLREFRPDVVVGLGGYVAGPAVLEAALQGVPTLLIEPNAIPGFTNRVLGSVVRLAAVGFEATARFYGRKARFTGHPVRKAFFEIPAREHTPPFTVLVLGGSQGSKAINDCVVRTLALLPTEAGRLRVVHQTGERDYNAVQEAYQKLGLAAEICPFIEDMPQAFARADLVISRSGAITVAELGAAGKASLLIPFPAAADQHQLENARTLERAGAARVLDEREATPERLAREVQELVGDPRKLARMERAAKTLARPDAAGRIADLIEELAM